MSALSPEELDGLLQRTLAQAGGALTLPAIERGLPRGLRPARATLSERLAALVGEGRAHRWPGKRPQYAARPYAEYLRGWLLETLAAGPRTAGQLRQRVPASAHRELAAVLGELTREGRVFKHPRLGRVEPYATRPPDPLPYLRRPLEAELKKLQKKGFSRDDLLAALRRLAGGPGSPAAEPAPAAADRVLEALVELNPGVREGELVFLPHLRHALAGELDRAAFDRAVLALHSQGRVQLQAHPVPGQLGPDEREALIPDGRGSWFMAIGLRRS